MSKKEVTAEELSKHDKVDDLWVAINGKVYDFTQFAPEHPGTSSLRLSLFFFLCFFYADATPQEEKLWYRNRPEGMVRRRLNMHIRSLL